MPSFPCEPNPCVHGRCAELDGGFECQCLRGYEGVTCNIDHDDCNPNPCSSGATCEDQLGSALCRCPAEYTGEDCTMLRFQTLGATGDCAVADMEPGDLSGDGLVVVGSCGLGKPFRWTAQSGFQTLPGTGSITATNFDGSVIVGTVPASSPEATSVAYRMQWPEASQRNFPAAGVSSGMAVSDDASVVVVTLGEGDSRQPWVWHDDDALEAVGVAGEANAMSGDGSTLTGWLASNGQIVQPYWYRIAEADLLQLTPVPGTSYGIGFGANRDGSVVVGESFGFGAPGMGIERAFRWSTESGMQDLGIVPGFDGSIASDVSADGNVVAINGYSAKQEGNDGAALWDAVHGIRPLVEILRQLGANVDGWTLGAVYALSADGKVAMGRGLAPDGSITPWIAQLGDVVVEAP